MNLNEETAKLVEQYLNGELDPAARSAFETRCTTDPEFGDQVRAHVQAVYAERTHAEAARRQRLNDLYDQQVSSKPLRRLSLRMQVLAAAAVVILLVGLVLAIRQLTPPDPHTLYAAYYEPEPFSGRRTSSVWQAAGDAYTLGDFPEAIQLLEALLADSTFDNRPRAQYYLAHSYLQSDQPQQALSIFGQVSPESSFIDQSAWYMALIDLQLKNRDAAMQRLQLIAEQPAHYRRKQARELLEALER